MDGKFIEEVLPLVREGWRDAVKVALMTMSCYNSTKFTSLLTSQLILNSGQLPDIADIDTCVSAVERKLNDHTCIHLLIGLSYPRSYVNSLNADEELSKLRARAKAGDYYNGEFVTIDGSNAKMFSFAKTLPASGARQCNFQLEVNGIDTCKILPTVQQKLVQVDVRVILTTKTGMKRAREESWEKGWEAGICDLYKIESDIKSLENLMDTAKQAEGSLVTQAEGSIVTQPAEESLVTQAYNLELTPDEPSKFKCQYKDIVRGYNLRVKCNVSNMIENSPLDTHFSKYDLSKSDGAIFHECTAYIHGESAYIHGESEDAILFSSNEEISKMLEENLAICPEAKVRLCGEPVGQLFAGLDKLLADLIFEKLSTDGKLISAFTLFGVNVNKCDECEVYKFEVVLNQRTKVWKR